MKTKLLSLLLVACSGIITAQSLYTSLLEVNNRWAYEEDYPSEVLELPATYNPIGIHLKYVHNTLSSRPVNHLTEAQRLSRANLLDELLVYAEMEEFPVNLLHPTRQPVFIGPFGNYCAVGHLIKASGHNDLALKISGNMNYEYLLDMNDDDLNKWVFNSGFTAEELAWIQPGYPANAMVQSMKGGTNGSVETITTLGSGEILAAGVFDTAGAIRAPGIAEYISGFAGYDWLGIGSGGLIGGVYDTEHFNNGIVAAGYIYQADSNYVHSGIAFWDGMNWTGMGSFYVGALVNTIYDVEVYNGELYAAGFFRSNMSAPAPFSHIAKWDGTKWVGLGSSPTGTVRSLEVYDGNLILAGDFEYIDTTAYNHIAAYNPSLGFFSLAGGVPTYLNALEAVGDTLYAGGSFFTHAQQDTFGLGYFYNNTWTRIEGFDLSSSNYIQVNTIKQTPYGLFIGGSLSYQPLLGNYGKNLLRYNNGYLEGYAVLDSTVNDLQYSEGMLYIGGHFTNVISFGNPVALNHIGYTNLQQQFSLLEDNIAEHISLYPLPAREAVVIESNLSMAISKVEAIDISGKVMPVRYELHDAGLKLDVSSWPVGSYYLKLSVGDDIAHKKLVVH